LKSFVAVLLSRLKIMFCIILHTHTGSWDSVVSIENGLRAGNRGGVKYFLFFKSPKPSLRPIHHLMHCVPGATKGKTACT
jgi:hypothetical protein